MKTEQISASIFSRAGSGDTQLIHGLDKDQWLKTITAGQILKGRVLKAYADNKYGVSFGEQERIVDSAVPLAVGDTLTGRVTGVKDNTVSMKLVNTTVISESKPETLDAARLSEFKSPVEVEAERFKIDLNQVQKNAINKAANQVGNAMVAIRAGLYLAKLGLPITIDLVRVLAERVLDTQSHNLTNVDTRIPQLLSSVEVSRLQQLSTLEGLNKFYFKEFGVDQQEQEGVLVDDADNELKQASKAGLHMLDANVEQQDLPEQQLLNQMLSKLLNVNNGSVAQHRLQTLPLMIDGKLVEFDVAFFDQSERHNKNQVLESKRVKFALNTEFGLLNLEANIVNNRLSISFVAENEYFIDQLGEYAPELKASLADAGWVVDYVGYQKATVDSTAAYDVVKHVLLQDSLDIEV